MPFKCRPQPTPGWPLGCGGHSHPHPHPLPTAQVTHKVRSLGMWLKLDTGMVVMLLLFSVLKGTDRPSSTCPARTHRRQDPSAHIVALRKGVTFYPERDQSCSGCEGGGDSPELGR